MEVPWSLVVSGYNIDLRVKILYTACSGDGRGEPLLISSLSAREAVRWRCRALSRRSRRQRCGLLSGLVVTIGFNDQTKACLYRENGEELMGICVHGFPRGVV